MGYVEDTLSDGEVVEHVGKLDVWAYVIQTALAAPLFWVFRILLFQNSGFIKPLIIVVVFFGLKYLFDVWLTEMKITSHRIVLKKGIIFRKTEELNRDAVETAKLNQSLFGRIFGYGSVEIMGRGIGNVAFKDIDEPVAFRTALLDKKVKANSSSSTNAEQSQPKNSKSTDDSPPSISVDMATVIDTYKGHEVKMSDNRIFVDDGVFHNTIDEAKAFIDKYKASD
jgi:uncharacterized membrane protein YdbT with pleckstrin-like domain